MPCGGDGGSHGFEPRKRQFVARPGQCARPRQPLGFVLCFANERGCAEAIDRRIAVDGIIQVRAKKTFRFVGDNAPGHQRFVAAPERIVPADVRARLRKAGLQTEEHSRLAAVSCDQMNDVHGPALPDSVNPPDALLEPDGIPWQLEVDDEATPLLQIEPFASGVGREQKTAASVSEVLNGLEPFVPRHSAVQGHGRQSERCLQMQQCVAILREDDRRLIDAA
jgi:hypothetical protein